MSVDRHGARKRVKQITVWSAAGAAALTAGLAFGASRDAPATTKAAAPTVAEPEVPQVVQPEQPGYGYEPPAASSGPPAGMSGGS